MLFKKVLSFLLLIFIGSLIGWALRDYLDDRNESTSSLSPIINLRPLDKYTLDALSEKSVPSGVFEILEQEPVEEEEENDLEGYNENKFTFEFSPDLSGKGLKKTTGQINIPDNSGPFPLVLMLRGYVDSQIYETGVGTSRAAEVFAQNGFLTIAPDFLGYGESDPQEENVMEARFQTYTTVLSLLESLDQVESWDGENVFIWGHSNGGQIALTVLEITKREIPTTLWAPVSKPFPYSILYYTDESEDRGKFLRREIARFEETYDANLYSLDLYLDRINAPLQLHQGTADDAIPTGWSNELVDKLEESEKDITYFTYPGVDHNMRPVWDTVVTRDLAFFSKNLVLE